MFYRKDAVALAVCSLLAGAGYAMAEGTEAQPALTLDAPVVNAAAAAPRSLLMGGLDQVGAGKTLDSLGLNIYGWVEGGYTYNHRGNHGFKDTPRVLGGTFNHEANNRFMMNQLDLRFERLVDMKKSFDVGGMVELLYGNDGTLTHANGLEFGGTNLTTNPQPDDVFNPEQQFDIPQAYVDLAFGQIGNGLKVRVGKFVTLMSYETLNPVNNPFYSHSYIFSALPISQTGVLFNYNINDQWAVTAGATRGWDQSLEDNNGGGCVCGWDFLGQIAYTPNKQLGVYLNLSEGRQNNDGRTLDGGWIRNNNWRTAINPVVVYHMTDKLKLGLDGIYMTDGGWNDGSYGDAWGAALYAGYEINDMFTVNGRVEKFHDFRFGTSLNFYEVTLGVAIKPFPKDPIGSNLIIRPEVRYDFSEDHVYPVGRNGDVFKDQLTFGADVIFTF